jgi:hypothetical protein
MATKSKSKVSKAPVITPIVADAVFEQMLETATEAALTNSAVDVPVTPKGQGIGQYAKELIAEGKTNEEVVELVKARFVGASTNRACVAWYRADMKRRAK